MGEATESQENNKEKKHGDHRRVEPAKMGDQPVLDHHEGSARLLAEAASVETEGDNQAGRSKKDRAVHGMQNVVGEKAAIFLQGFRSILRMNPYGNRHPAGLRGAEYIFGE